MMIEQWLTSGFQNIKIRSKPSYQVVRVGRNMVEPCLHAMVGSLDGALEVLEIVHG